MPGRERGIWKNHPTRDFYCNKQTTEKAGPGALLGALLLGGGLFRGNRGGGLIDGAACADGELCIFVSEALVDLAGFQAFTGNPAPRENANTDCFIF